jgi:hypothetical protein
LPVASRIRGTVARFFAGFVGFPCLLGVMAILSVRGVLHIDRAAVRDVGGLLGGDQREHRIGRGW